MTNTTTKSRKRKQAPPARQSRPLSDAERRVKTWIRSNHGVLSQLAREYGLSVQFVQRIAYNREAKSKDFRVEHRLLQLGCPLIQPVD